MMHLVGKRLVPAVLLTLALGLSQAAKAHDYHIGDTIPPPGGGTSAPGADPSYLFTYSDGTNIASGLLQTTANGDGSETVTGVSMTVTGGADAGTYTLFTNPNAPGAAFSPSGAFIYDDQLFPGGGPGNYLNINGLLFTNGSGQEINIWGNGGANNYSFYSFIPGVGYDTTSSSGTFTLTAIPEASTMLGFGGLLGAGGLGMLRSRRSRKTN